MGTVRKGDRVVFDPHGHKGRVVAITTTRLAETGTGPRGERLPEEAWYATVEFDDPGVGTQDVALSALRVEGKE